MAAQHNAPVTGELVDGMKYLIPAVVGQRLDQRIQADHGLFLEAVENESFQPLAGRKNRCLSVEQGALRRESSGWHEDIIPCRRCGHITEE
jgi:hypothetical protein